MAKAQALLLWVQGGVMKILKLKYAKEKQKKIQNILLGQLLVMQMMDFIHRKINRNHHFPTLIKKVTFLITIKGENPQ